MLKIYRPELAGVARLLTLPNMPGVWKLVAMLAQQAHVIHCTVSKMLYRRPRTTTTHTYIRAYTHTRHTTQTTCAHTPSSPCEAFRRTPITELCAGSRQKWRLGARARVRFAHEAMDQTHVT